MRLTISGRNGHVTATQLACARPQSSPRAVSGGFCLPDSPEFDTWASLERERWTRLGLQALAALIETFAIDADYRSAIDYAQRYLAIDELAEDIHRRLIELYALAGNRSAALRQYERCVTVLERELGVSPTPETQAVYRAVLHGVALSCAGHRAAMDRSRVAGRGDAAGRTHRRPADAGRAFIPRQLGHGEMILIAGEPGVGKSRLMQEFAMRVRSQALVLAGAGFPKRTPAPISRSSRLCGPTWRCVASSSMPTHPGWRS